MTKVCQCETIYDLHMLIDGIEYCAKCDLPIDWGPVVKQPRDIIAAVFLGGFFQMIWEYAKEEERAEALSNADNAIMFLHECGFRIVTDPPPDSTKAAFLAAHAEYMFRVLVGIMSNPPGMEVTPEMRGELDAFRHKARVEAGIDTIGVSEGAQI